MEINTKNSISVTNKIIPKTEDIDLDNNKISEFINLIYLLGYYNGKASIISGGDGLWKQKILPLIINNKFDQILEILKNILKGIEDKKKENPYGVF